MSARLTIVTYNNAQAIIVPAQAISHGEDGLWVEYRAAMDKPVERVNITTGQSTAQGVEVFGLKPGFIKTDMTEGLDENELKGMIPVKRFGTPEEVAHTVGFLASKGAGYITAEVISVNGGLYS